MKHLTLSGNRISVIDENSIMEAKNRVKVESSAWWKHFLDVLTSTYGASNQADWELKAAFILFFEILLMIIFLFSL